ncbi:MAG: phospholipid carrier-dependent glycosyltransferase [Christensenellaceae bacterium]|jgi:Gpi18-like mannosyltransferase|nr:phospholipid carrier-dependent glycosyltransferase [Christensenellaceae bacterium]
MKRRLALLTALVLVLLALPVQALAAEGENLLKNPEFQMQDGRVLEWYYGGWESQTGSFAFDVLDEGGERVLFLENLVPNDARLEQELALSRGSNYRFSAFIKAEGFAEGDAGANLSFLNTFVASEGLRDTGGEWIYVEVYGKTGFFQGGSHVLALRLGFYGNEGQGRAWFKNVRLEKLASLPAGVVPQSLQTLSPQAPAKAEGEEGANWVPLFAFLAVLGAALLFFGLPKACHTKLSGEALRLALRVGLILALGLRLVLSIKIEGYGVDYSCFTAWAARMADVGPLGFYAEDYFADYPPGYFYILWPIGLLRNFFALSQESLALKLLIKLPSVLADLGAACLIYALLRKRAGENAAAFAALGFAFLPAIWLDSAMWGQVDGILSLLLLLSLYFYDREKPLPASLIYGLAVLFKPQALLFGVIPLFAFALRILNDKKQGFKELGACALSALALILALSFPFVLRAGGYQYLLDLYLNTLGSYPYATVNAMNLFGLLGGNWVDQTLASPLGLSWQALGLIGMGLSLAFSFFVFFKGREKRAIPLAAACLLLGVFVLGVRMHERYMFPILALLFLAALEYDDRRLLLCLAGLSATNAINIFIVLSHEHVTAGDRVTQLLIGLANLFLLGLLWFTALRLCLRKRNLSLSDAGRPAVLEAQVLGPKLPNGAATGEPARFTRWDFLLIAAMMLVYAPLAFFGLGNSYAPQTVWKGALGQEAVLDLGQEQSIGRFYYYGDINHGRLEISFSGDGQSYGDARELELGTYSMFKWESLKPETTARYVKVRVLEVKEPAMQIFELALTDGEGKPYAFAASPGAEALADEQWMVPEHPGYLDSMYFDEVYHGRTAYEQLHGMEWYENTHPPLGKVFMSWSIALFGMTPFGWRFAGTLAGLLMIPAMYFLAKQLFRGTAFAAIATGLLTFDFMHLAQTRLATIDSYPVLFIILSFGFMLRYASMSFYHQPLLKTLVPLFFSGLFMGLGIASKWIGLYAAIGLALLFFGIFLSRLAEYRAARRAEKKSESDEAILRLFPKSALYTLLSCLVFFVAIPVLIYVGSYYQFLAIDAPRHGLQEVWNYQTHMLNYHKNVFATHPYESPWWQWPLMIRPIWYFVSQYPPEGTISSIASFGNPAVWWPGALALIWLIIRALRGYGRRDPRIYFILLGFGANYLPWVLVPRTTFIYHYFASVPFIILALTLFLEDFYAKQKHAKAYIASFLCVVVLLFFLFYPVLTGVPMPAFQGSFLKWLPSWTLF